MGSWDRARLNLRTFDALNAPIAAFVVGDGDGVSGMRDTRLFYALVPRRLHYDSTNSVSMSGSVARCAASFVVIL